VTAGFMRAIARLEQAYESDDDGRFLALAEEFIRRYPQVPDGHATLGEALQRNGRYAQAVASVEQAMSKGFDATHGHLILAAIHDDAGDTAKSLREYTLVAGSDDAEVRQFCLLNRARLLLRIDDVEQAVKDANAAIAILPDESAYAVRGHVHRRRGDLEAALRDYERAIQLSPGNPDLQDNRAQVLELLGRTEQTHAKQTVAKEPKDVAAIPQRQPQPAPRPTPQPAPQPAPQPTPQPAPGR
jgi:tetratricopeptide (TPR) repeat protein